jgi:hypothetical protein
MSVVNENKSKQNSKALLRAASVDLELIKTKDHDTKAKTNESLKKLAEIVRQLIDFMNM